MNDLITNSLIELEGLSITTILLNNGVALAISLFIMLTYKLTYSGTAYSKMFNVSLGMITIVTTLIMSVISNNIALSLGMVGALSIIRFRTAIKNVRDATFIFWVIAVGISCGVSQYLLAAISSVIIFIFLLIMKQAHVEGKFLVIIKCTIEAQKNVEFTVDQFLSKKANLRMKNVNLENCEMIFEVSKAALKKAETTFKTNLVSKLLKMDGVLNINQVEQTENISR